MVGQLDAKIKALDIMAETYDRTKADDLSYENNILQLKSNGKKVGSPINIVSGEGGDNPPSSEFEIVEF